MNFNLNNKWVVPLVSSAAVALVMASATPLSSRANAVPLVAATALAVEIGTDATLASVLQPAMADAAATESTPSRPRTTPRRHRQSLLMPYFSFAPRG